MPTFEEEWIYTCFTSISYLFLFQENSDLTVEESQIIQDDTDMMQDSQDVQALADKYVYMWLFATFKYFLVVHVW